MIVPDLPVDEAERARGGGAPRAESTRCSWRRPGRTPERLAEIGRRSRGFVYCVATYGVTGARDRARGHRGEAVVDALRPHTDLPLLVGVGIGAPEQAAEACAFADGVVVGSALMARVVGGDLDGAVAPREPSSARRSPPEASVPRHLRRPAVRMTRGNGPGGLANRGRDVIVTLRSRGTGREGGLHEAP